MARRTRANPSPASARFGRPGIGDETLSVTFNANSLIYLTDRITGHFRGGAFQHALSEVHEDATIKIRQGLVQELNKRIKRTDRGPTSRPRRLAPALLDDRNREATASGFTVLRPSWMDQSPAELYWRQIEEGNPKQYTWSALFTNTYPNKPFYGPWSKGGGSRKMPPGYKHGRMPQNLPGAPTFLVGPWDPYEFTKGGQRVMDNYDFYGEYAKRLARIGIDIDAVWR